MKALSETKGEKLAIKCRALYLSSAGPRRLKADLKGETVSVGAETWEAKPHHRWTRGAGVKWDFVLPQGRSEALAPWGEIGPITAEGLDAIVNNNMVEQLNRLTQPRQANKLGWVQVSISLALILAVVGSAIFINSRMDALEKLEKGLHPQAYAAMNAPPQPAPQEPPTPVHTVASG